MHHDKLVELSYELLLLKESLVEHKLESTEEVIIATEAYFANRQKMYFSEGLKKLVPRWVGTSLI